MTDFAIEIENVSLTLGQTLVLKDVTLRIARGTFLGLIGPNGGGKTTLLKCILGLLKPDRGTVTVLDQPATRVRPKGAIGYVPQHPIADLDFPVSIDDVVMMSRYPGIGAFGKASARDREIALRVLNDVGMAELKDRIIGQLSGGQQQRVLIARALASEPEILLLDEPTTGVDTRAQNEFYQLLGRLKNELNLTIVLVSHDIGVIPYYTDEVACVNQVMHLHGRSKEVLTAESLRQAYGCEVELLVHGKIPHRVVGEHDD
jgi:zinc transport system ATP-binding protein